MTFAPVNQALLHMNRRLVAILAVLIMLQLTSAFVGVGEAMFDHEPTLLSVLACAALALGWLVLAACAGRHRLNVFPWVASIFWGILAAIIVAAMLAASSATDSLESGTQLGLLPLMFFAAVPLDPLAQLLPIDDQLTRCLIVAGGIFALCLVGYSAAAAGRREPKSR